MTPILWAQSLAEYGVMAALTDKVGRAYTAIELSIRTNSEMWLLGCGVVLLALWLFRR
jgi:hypothetical protein